MILAKNFSTQVNGLPVKNHLIRRMGQVYLGKPGTSLVTFMSPVLSKNVHVIMLQGQIVKTPNAGG